MRDCGKRRISQDSSQFKPTRSQRQVLQRFSNFIKLGTRQGEKGWGPPPPPPLQSSQLSQPRTATTTTTSEEKVKSAAAKGKGKAKNQNIPLDFNEMLHSGDWDNSPKSSGEENSFKNKFEYTVEPASFTEEKYALFKRYQVDSLFLPLSFNK